MTINKDWQDNEELRRYTLIAPLLQEDLDNAKRVSLRKQIAEANNMTIRSLYRYEKALKDQAFNGLRSMNRENADHRPCRITSMSL